MGVVGVTHGPLHKFNRRANCVVRNVTQQRSLAARFNQIIECVWNRSVFVTVKPSIVQGSRKLRCNPYDNVVRVSINAQHDDALRLHLQPILKLTWDLTQLVRGVNCCLTHRLINCYAQTKKLGCRGRKSHASFCVAPHNRLIYSLTDIHK
jgi:hypothetical protein